MKKTYIENSTFLELCCELTTNVVEDKFGIEGAYEDEDEDEIKFTEDAQDFFNSQYEGVETKLNKVGGIYSDIDKSLVEN